MVSIPQAPSDGDTVDTELRNLAERVAEAEEAIKAVLREAPGGSWTIRALQDEAATRGSWTPSVISIAYRRLARQGDVLTVGADLLVRAA